MKFYSRSNLYKASNVTFNPDTITAVSYDWWTFVKVIGNEVIFNDFAYSNSTRKHQYKVRSLLGQLGITYRVVDAGRAGLNDIRTKAQLAKAIRAEAKNAAEVAEAKRLARNAKSAFRRRTKKLEDYLENQCAFRDYQIFSKDQFGKRTDVAHHQLVDMSSMESDVSNALHSFHRGGFGSVVFYV